MSEDIGFAPHLRDLRKQSGLSQDELAELVEISVMTIRRWEWGQRVPRLEEIKKLAEVLQVSESELLNGPVTKNWELNLVVSKTNEGGAI